MEILEILSDSEEGEITIYLSSWDDVDTLFNSLMQDKELTSVLNNYDVSMTAIKYYMFSEGNDSKVEYLIQATHIPYRDKKIDAIVWRKITKALKTAIGRNNNKI